MPWGKTAIMFVACKLTKAYSGRLKGLENLKNLIMEKYNAFGHTGALLEQILKMPNLSKEKDELGKLKGTKDLHTVLKTLYNDSKGIPLFYSIYNVLGSSCSPDYFKTPITKEELETYQRECEANRKSHPEFQRDKKSEGTSYDYMLKHPGDYLMCHTAVKDVRNTERIILNFVTQRDAFEFVKRFKDLAEPTVSFKVCLGNGEVRRMLKNDKVVIYYPGDQRAIVKSHIITGLGDLKPQNPISGFYHQIQEGMGLAPETNPYWSFTMFTSEYLCEYLLGISTYQVKDMFDYVMSRLALPTDFEREEV